MVQAQHAQDLKILALVKAMEKTYSFIVSADELKDSPVLQDIIVQILKNVDISFKNIHDTILEVCCRFIGAWW